jgi:pyrroline-5-carboxylate reductase
MPWHLYMVRCGDGSLYTGIATDVDKRVAAHAAGRGAKYTRGRGPITLAYLEACGDRGLAAAREHAVKRLPRTEKEVLSQQWLRTFSPT